MSGSSIAVTRDFWDWAVVFVTLLAGLAALIAIWVWVGQKRQTPEVRFSWRKPAVSGADLERWYPGDLVELAPHQTYRVRVNITNIGTGPADKIVINLMTPGWMQIQQCNSATSTGSQIAHESWVTNPPTDELKYIVMTPDSFFPGLQIVCEFAISFTDSDPTGPTGNRYHLAASVEAHELIGSGRRWIPSLAQRVGEDDRPHWKQVEWPGKKYRRWPRRVSADPKESVRCGPGKRIDRRAFRVRDQ